MVDLHEINRTQLLNFLHETNHPSFVELHKTDPAAAETIAVGGALTLLTMLVDADGFFDEAQIEALVIICRQLIEG